MVGSCAAVKGRLISTFVDIGVSRVVGVSNFSDHGSGGLRAQTPAFSPSGGL